MLMIIWNTDNIGVLRVYCVGLLKRLELILLLVGLWWLLKYEMMFHSQFPATIELKKYIPIQKNLSISAYFVHSKVSLPILSFQQYTRRHLWSRSNFHIHTSWSINRILARGRFVFLVSHIRTFSNNITFLCKEVFHKIVNGTSLYIF